MKSLSHVRFLATPWAAAYQALLSMGFSRQEYWSGVPLPSPLIVRGYRNFSVSTYTAFGDGGYFLKQSVYSSSSRDAYNLVLFADK